VQGGVARGLVPVRITVGTPDSARSLRNDLSGSSNVIDGKKMGLRMASNETLVEQFRELGVPDPEDWARSQIDEGIDQVSRATVLRAIADIVVKSSKDAPMLATTDWGSSKVKAAAERLYVNEEAAQDIETLLKAVLFQAFWDFMVISDGNAGIPVNPAKVNIGLYSRDDDFQPRAEIGGLHESWSEVAAATIGEGIVKYY